MSNKDLMTPEVIDFNEARAKKLEEKRRNTERVFFKNLLGMYCVTDSTHMRPVELIDVSEEGCAFQVPFNPDHPWPADQKEIPVRLYFTQDTFLGVTLQIQNSAPSIQDGIRTVRYGCTIDKTTQSYETFKGFVKFLKSFAVTASKDLGDVRVFYL